MKKVIKIPEYKDVKEVTLSYWCVSVGEEVKENDILAVVETSEAILELEAGIAGEVLALLVKEGDKLSVDDEIAMIGIDIERLNKTLSSIGITDKASIVNEVLPKFPSAKFKKVLHVLEGQQEVNSALEELNQELGCEYKNALLDTLGLDSIPNDLSEKFQDVLDEIIEMGLRFLKKEHFEGETLSSSFGREISEAGKWKDIKEKL